MRMRDWSSDVCSSDLVAMAAERIDEQIGAERRSADADVEQMADLAERARFDRVDHHPHPLMQSLCGMDRFRRAIATLGAMLGRAVFGGIGDAAREERLAQIGRAHV